MKLKYSFEAVDMGEEIILVPVGEGASSVHGILKINNEGREILDLLKSETTQERIVETLSAKYENDIESLRLYVGKVLNTLQSSGLLDE